MIDTNVASQLNSGKVIREPPKIGDNSDNHGQHPIIDKDDPGVDISPPHVKGNRFTANKDDHVVENSIEHSKEINLSGKKQESFHK